jgi:NAD(P)H-dependent nitrite reductase small subunit
LETNGEFLYLCDLTDLPEIKGKKYTIDDEEIAVFKIKENVYALSNVCPHQHKAIICDGFLEDNLVVCPAHGWKFRLEDGKQPGNRNGLRSHFVKIRNNKVYIKLAKSKLNW